MISFYFAIALINVIIHIKYYNSNIPSFSTCLSDVYLNIDSEWKTQMWKYPRPIFILFTLHMQSTSFQK